MRLWANECFWNHFFMKENGNNIKNCRTSGRIFSLGGLTDLTHVLWPPHPPPTHPPGVVEESSRLWLWLSLSTFTRTRLLHLLKTQISEEPCSRCRGLPPAWVSVSDLLHQTWQSCRNVNVTDSLSARFVYVKSDSVLIFREKHNVLLYCRFLLIILCVSLLGTFLY